MLGVQNGPAPTHERLPHAELVEEGDGRFRLRFAAVTVTCSSAIYLDVIFTGLLIIGQICTLLFTFLLAMFVDDLGVAFSGWRISSYP